MTSTRSFGRAAARLFLIKPSLDNADLFAVFDSVRGRTGSMRHGSEPEPVDVVIHILRERREHGA